MPKILSKKENSSLGYYLILDLYGCDHATTESLEICYTYLDNLAEMLGIVKLSPPFIVRTDGEKYPDKAGLSGWIPFVNEDNWKYSGSSIHTLVPTDFISIDVYSCKKFDKEKIKKFTEKIFKPLKTEEKFFTRGG